MADLKNNESKTVSHRRVENGYIINQETARETKKGMDYKTKTFVAKTAGEAEKMLEELIK